MPGQLLDHSPALPASTPPFADPPLQLPAHSLAEPDSCLVVLPRPVTARCMRSDLKQPPTAMFAKPGENASHGGRIHFRNGHFLQASVHLPDCQPPGARSGNVGPSPFAAQLLGQARPGGGSQAPYRSPTQGRTQGTHRPPAGCSVCGEQIASRVRPFGARVCLLGVFHGRRPPSGVKGAGWAEASAGGHTCLCAHAWLVPPTHMFLGCRRQADGLGPGGKSELALLGEH